MINTLLEHKLIRKAVDFRIFRSNNYNNDQKFIPLQTILCNKLHQTSFALFCSFNCHCKYFKMDEVTGQKVWGLYPKFWPCNIHRWQNIHYFIHLHVAHMDQNICATFPKEKNITSVKQSAILLEASLTVKVPNQHTEINMQHSGLHLGQTGAGTVPWHTDETSYH